MKAILDKINIGSIWTMIAGTALAIMYMFNTFATAADVKEISVSIWYGQYYDRLDDYDEAVEEGNSKLAKEYKRMMEMLEAKICEEDPEWERCKD